MEQKRQRQEEERIIVWKKGEEMRIEQEKKRERMEIKRKMEERWGMLRWISNYIDKNQESWEREREIEKRNKVSNWKKLKRFQKISTIREREKEKKNLKKNKNRETPENNGWRWEKWR